MFKIGSNGHYGCRVNVRRYKYRYFKFTIMNFSEGDIRIIHVQRKHKCTMCDFRTHKKYNLNVHLRGIHGISVTNDNKCSQNVKINYCAHCDYNSPYSSNMKRHIGIKHAPILDQEDVGEDIAGGRVNTPFTEQDELHVKDEVKDPELLEDSIEVLKIYKLLQRMKNK